MLQGLLPIKLDLYMPNFDDCMQDKARCTENEWYLALPVHILHTCLHDMSRMHQIEAYLPSEVQR